MASLRTYVSHCWWLCMSRRSSIELECDDRSLAKSSPKLPQVIDVTGFGSSATMPPWRRKVNNRQIGPGWWPGRNSCGAQLIGGLIFWQAQGCPDADQHVDRRQARAVTLVFRRLRALRAHSVA